MIKQSKTHLNIVATLIFALMLTFAGFAVSAQPVRAATAYELIKYDFNAVVSKDHSYAVQEKITVNLPDEATELQFAVPKGNFVLSNLTVDNANFLQETIGNNSFVVITDSEKLTKGQHTFSVSYTLQEFADRNEAEDMFYFDVLLPGWTQPITAVDIKVQFPEDFPWDDMQYYAGQFGVQDVNTKLDFKADKASHTVKMHGDKIPENFGITLKSDLPNGYWEGMINGSWATNLMMIVALLTTLLLLVLWFIGGRDPKFPRAKQVHPIEGITPVEMGYIFIGRVRVRDVIAMIVYMGIKGYLRISEYAPKKYRIIKVTNPVDEEKYIRNAYDILFEDVPEDRGVDWSELRPRLRRIKRYMNEDVAAGFSSKEMLSFTPLSRAFRIAGIILLSFTVGIIDAMKYAYNYEAGSAIEYVFIGLVTAALLTVLCRQFDRYYYAEQKYFTIWAILLAIAVVLIPVYLAVTTIVQTGQWLPAIVTALLILAAVVLVLLMRARARGNAELTNKFLGLRHFIYHPTAKDIAENAFADINYYYEIMPYALLFNGLEAWAISFISLDVPAPEWYSDDIPGSAITNLRTEQETVVDIARDIKAFARTIEDTYHNK